MATSRTKNTMTVPPQLIGVLDDAIQIAATSFKLETFPTHIMASFSVPSQAMEIDFEMDAGQEMIDYLVAQATAGRIGRFSLEYHGRRLDCQVTLDKRRRPSWVQISWA
jgi:uncharacterized protein with von Willebrand factor type A (vWA) domain